MMADGLPDIIGENLSILFCGINPGLQAAALGQHFSGRGNRFWRVAYLAGFTARELTPEGGNAILEYGCGLTTVVGRPTASASELAHSEFLSVSAGFEHKIARYAPRFVAFLGKAAYSGLRGRRDVEWGLQPGLLATSKIWILPNPSGRNRAFSLDQLVQAYAGLRTAMASI